MTSSCSFLLYLVVMDRPCTDKEHVGEKQRWCCLTEPISSSRAVQANWDHVIHTIHYNSIQRVRPAELLHRLVPRDGEYSTKNVHRLLRQTTEQALSPCAGCRKQNWEGKNEKWQDIDLLIATLQTHRSGGWVGGWLSSHPRLIEIERECERRERMKDFSTDWFASFWTWLSVCVVLTGVHFYSKWK